MLQQIFQNLLPFGNILGCSYTPMHFTNLYFNFESGTQKWLKN